MFKSKIFLIVIFAVPFVLVRPSVSAQTVEINTYPIIFNEDDSEGMQEQNEQSQIQSSQGASNQNNESNNSSNPPTVQSEETETLVESAETEGMEDFIEEQLAQSSDFESFSEDENRTSIDRAKDVSTKSKNGSIPPLFWGIVGLEVILVIMFIVKLIQYRKA